MTTAWVLIPVNPNRGGLGLPSRVDERWAGRTVLAHSVSRAAQVESVRGVILVHPPDVDPTPLLEGASFARPVHTFAVGEGWDAPVAVQYAAGRKWAAAAWRGGVGGACIFDELLPLKPLAGALAHHGGDSALLLGADWPLVDPDICSRVLAIHLSAPEAMKLSFSQAPPGLGGVAVAGSMLSQFAQHGAAFAQPLRYNPTTPAADPIGRDVCHQVPATVRSCQARFVYDTPRSVAMLDAIARRLGDAVPQADAATVTATPEAGAYATDFAALPPWVTLELTPRRTVRGPITPQHHVTFERPDMPTDLAVRLVRQLGEATAGGDVALMLGGLGDPLLHPQWDRVVEAAHDAGVLGIGLDTDLLCDPSTLNRILELPIDVLAIRMNADTPATYQKVMGVDRFNELIKHVEDLFNARARRAREGDGPFGRAALPWIVPKFIKTPDTLADLESYFNRWMHHTGHALIEPATSGCGLMPEQSPVPMAPPRRRPCRQLGTRMTILANGQVAQCDQDWLGRAPLGDASATALADLWREAGRRRAVHLRQAWDELELCGNCSEWHRP